MVTIDKVRIHGGLLGTTRGVCGARTSRLRTKYLLNISLGCLHGLYQPAFTQPMAKPNPRTQATGGLAKKIVGIAEVDSLDK